VYDNSANSRLEVSSSVLRAGAGGDSGRAGGACVELRVVVSARASTLVVVSEAEIAPGVSVSDRVSDKGAGGAACSIWRRRVASGTPRSAAVLFNAAWSSDDRDGKAVIVAESGAGLTRVMPSVVLSSSSVSLARFLDPAYTRWFSQQPRTRSLDDS